MKIFVTGAESTGKSELTSGLSNHYDSPFVPEYARDYLGSLNREYTKEDVCLIARKQIEQIRENQVRELVFFDTGLIITQVWLEVRFNSSPPWLEKAIREYGPGNYLVCQPDIPWVDDPLRENPDRREELNRLYIDKIKAAGFHYGLVEGMDEKRLSNAISIVNGWRKKYPFK